MVFTEAQHLWRMDLVVYRLPKAGARGELWVTTMGSPGLSVGGLAR